MITSVLQTEYDKKSRKPKEVRLSWIQCDICNWTRVKDKVDSHIGISRPFLRKKYGFIREEGNDICPECIKLLELSPIEEFQKWDLLSIDADRTNVIKEHMKRFED